MANNQFFRLPGQKPGKRLKERADRSFSHREPRLRPSGGYRDLRSFQTATVIYDTTAAFCGRFIDKRSRTHDQMVQAARSGRQNIAEGSRAGATSSKTETHLTNVARASLDELLLDYEDFLRQRGLRQWGKDDPEALAVRRVGQSHRTDPTDRPDQTLKCPLCGKLMVLRTARKGRNAGSRFRGCSGYPDCKGARSFE